MLGNASVTVLLSLVSDKKYFFVLKAKPDGSIEISSLLLCNFRAVIASSS